MVFLLFSDKRVRGFGNKAMDGNREMTGKSFDDENGFGKRFMRFILLRLVSEIYKILTFAVILSYAVLQRITMQQHYNERLVLLGRFGTSNLGRGLNQAKRLLRNPFTIVYFHFHCNSIIFISQVNKENLHSKIRA